MSDKQPHSSPSRSDPLRLAFQDGVARSAVIRRVVHGHLRATGESMISMAERVREIYEARIDRQHRELEWSTHAEPYRRLARNAEKLTRFLSADSNTYFPADIEDAIVLSLPPPARMALETELSAGRGMLAVPMPVSNGDAIGNIADMMRSTAKVLETMAPVLADGRIDSDDLPYAPEAIVAIDQMMAQLAALHRALEEVVTGCTPTNVIALGSPRRT